MPSYGDEILWDQWGIPHIYGRDLADVAYGMGMAQMRSHGDLVLRLYGQARARGAELFGEDGLALDRWLCTMGVRERAEAWYAAQRPDERRVLDAFVAGMNAFAREHPDQIGAEVKAVLPVRPTDVLAHLQRVVHFTFIASPLAIEAQARALAGAGSNAWAIAPRRTAAGHAMLLANPHLFWGGFATLYEAHLATPTFDVYGVTFVGIPTIAIGFTRELAWTHTVNPIDGADTFALQLTRDGYMLDGKERAFDVRRETIRVKQRDGTMRDEPLEIKTSALGPIVGVAGDRALALRVAGLDAPHLIGQHLAMASATTLAEFERALAQQQLPMFNVIYADRTGHILEVFNGLVPRRPGGDVASWDGVIPAKDSSAAWTSYLPYGALPRMVDPASGWLQNANEPPWWMTDGAALDPARFPAYLAPRRIESLRTTRSHDLISALDRADFDSVIAAKFSTKMGLADRIVPDLIEAARRAGGRAREAAEVLAAWDRTADANSRGGVLFDRWAQLYFGDDGLRSRGWATAWREASPFTTPSGLADPRRAAAALAQAAEEVEKAYGAIDVPWGNVHRTRYAGVDVAASGCGDALGCFAAAYYDKAQDGTWVRDGGDSFIAVVELGTPVHAKAALLYGNSSRLGSPHQTDQLRFEANKQLRDVWLRREEVAQHLEAREPFSPQP